jgi:hypothetical protein
MTQFFALAMAHVNKGCLGEEVQPFLLTFSWLAPQGKSLYYKAMREAC